MREILVKGLRDLEIEFEETALSQFDIYAKTIVAYNEKVNLTAITDMKEIATKHFLDSVTPVAKGLIPFDAKIIDVGAGAGFPSLPIKIVRGDIKLTLLDSLEKRVNFLRIVCDKMGIQGVKFIHARAEDAAQNAEHRGNYNVAVSRAVANMRVLCEYCLPYVQVGGCFLALKGPSVFEELKNCENAIGILGGKFIKVVPVEFGSEECKHNIVVIKKIKQSPTKYPRKAGQPTKSPL